MPSAPPLHRHGFTAMASPCEVVLPADASKGGEQARAAAALAEAEVRRIEQKYSRYRADSVISQINAAAGRQEGLAVDAETAQLLDFAAALHQQSDGLFDISSGSLRRVWDFKAGREPSPEQLERQLACVGWHRLRWDGGRIALATGMEIDFGGIGKEYAADRAAAVLREQGFQHGFVNLGGDIRVIGPRADGASWTFAVQHPRRHGEISARLALGAGALATSGDYERFFITRDGRRCCHILDPRNGQPVRHWQAVSVVAPLCVAAGALATMAMLIGAEAVQRLRTPGVGFLLVDRQGRLLTHDPDQLLHAPRHEPSSSP